MKKKKPYHNYMRKLGRLIANGTLPPGTTSTDVEFRHGFGCGFKKETPKRCNCDPEIKLVEKELD